MATGPIKFNKTNIDPAGGNVAPGEVLFYFDDATQQNKIYVGDQGGTPVLFSTNSQKVQNSFGLLNTVDFETLTATLTYIEADSLVSDIKVCSSGPSEISCNVFSAPTRDSITPDVIVPIVEWTGGGVGATPPAFAPVLIQQGWVWVVFGECLGNSPLDIFFELTYHPYTP
jgi:hypothetical protein